MNGAPPAGSDRHDAPPLEPTPDPNSVSRGPAPRAKEMPFLEHLEELRRAIIDSLWGIVIGSMAGWFVAPRLTEFLIRPAGQLVFLGPADALNLRMKVAFFVGLVLAAPLVLWKLWHFVAPGLVTVERRVVGPLVTASSLLFVSGLLFADLVLAPFTFKFLLSFQSENLRPFLTADAYFGFLSKLCIVFGVVFQLPIVIGVLSWVGVVPARFLLGRWREAVLLIFIAAAIFTPPDVVSQVVMAGPILVLYALSVGVAFIVERRKKGRRDGGA